MACSIIRNRETNQIEKVLAPNGKDSILYKDALALQGDAEKALRMWAKAYTPSFINRFGNWQAEESFIKLDKNGEPLLEYIDRARFRFDFVGSLEQPVMDLFTEDMVQKQKAQIGQNIVTRLADKMSEKFGIPYTIVSASEARAITAQAANAWNGEKAFFFNGNVYFLNEGFTVENVLHEYSHPLIKAVEVQNPALFNNLYQGLSITPEGQQIIREVENLYPELTEENSQFKQEALVRALTMKAKTPVTSTGFKDFLNKILFAFKQALRTMFGKSVKIEKLSSDTTLAELAGMLKGDTFNVSTEVFTQEDLVDYARDISNFTKDLQDVEFSTLSNTVSRFYNLVSNQMRRIRENKNYSEARKFLVDETGRGELRELADTLKEYTDLDQVENERRTTQSFVHSILRLDKIVDKVKKHVKELQENGTSEEIIKNIFYYDILVRNWKTFMEETVNGLADAGVNPNSDFGRLIGGLQYNINQLDRVIGNIYANQVDDVLYDTLKPLSESIDKYFSDYIKELQDKNASEQKINDVTAKWNTLKLSKDKIKDMIMGKAGDTNMFSAYLEAYTNSPDPIVGGFSIFLKNALAETDVDAQRKINEMINELNPLLEKAGYSQTNFAALTKQLVHEEEVPFENDQGEFDTYKVWSYIDRFKSYSIDIQRLKYEFDEAQRAGDAATADLKLKELRKLKRDYFHQEYVPEFYDREKIYDSELGREAYRRKQVILNDIRIEDAQSYDEDSIDEIAERKKVLWRDYAQLASLTDAAGNPKTGRELEIAKIERDYRKASREFFEWVPIEGMFESSLRKYEQKLVDQGVAQDSPEFKNLRDKWLANNTVLAYTQEFYDSRNDILDRLRDAMQAIPEDTRKSIDITEEMEEILSISTGFRDQDGQVIGTDMTQATKDKIKTLQKEILSKRNSMAGYSGLTREEMTELSELFQKVVARDPNNPVTNEERNRIDELVERKNTLGVDKFTKAEIQSLYGELMQLQSKEATDYYTEIVNAYLDQMGIDQVDNMTAERILQPEEYTKLFQASSEFEKWFKDNHISKEVYDKASGQNKIVYERLVIWNRTRPNNPDHYEKITLSDGEVIQGKPNISYFRRSVKKQYRTKREIGKTIDNRGNWLPRTLEEGAVDDRYYNADYERLRREKPEVFAVLEKIKEIHLKFQEGLPRESRLGLAVPRYRKMSKEVISSAKVVNPFRKWYSALKQVFFKANDDAEDGLGFNPEKLVYADMFDEEIHKVPIGGLYRLNLDEVSMNLFDSTIRYMRSGLRQKKLIELNPFAQALKKSLSSPDAAIKDMNKINKNVYKNTGIKAHIKQKNQSTRSKAIDNIYERVFEGKTQKGLIQKYLGSGALKFLNHSLGLANFGMFAVNILPSALKNRFGAAMQLQIEASGGRFLNWNSYMRGKARATLMASELSSTFYSAGTKSLNVQLIQIFDPTQGILDTVVGEGSGAKTGGMFGRSLASDAASLSFFLSPRKWLDMELQIETFSGVMHHVMVPQTTGDTTNMIRYVDAFELVNGQIELKAGIPAEYGPKGEKFNEVRNQIHELNNRMFGTYASFDQPELQRYAEFRLISFLKRYFTSMLMNRFASTRTSAALGTVSTGSVTSLLQIIRDTGRYGLKNFAWLSNEQRRNIMKILADGAHQLALLAITSIVFGYDPEDEDRFEKMRDRSGAMNEDDFKAMGWLHNHGIIVALKTLEETETFGSWNPLSVKPDGSLDFNLFQNNFRIMKNTGGSIVSVTAYTSAIQNYLEFLQLYAMWLNDDDKAYYKKDAGSLPWQKEGEAKWKNELGKIFGVSGSQIDPETYLRNAEKYRR